MNSNGAITAEVRAMLTAMVTEAQELKQAAGGSVTDAVAAWLAPQYLLAARQQLSATEDANRLAMLRTFVQDWALLRRGDHTAARLQLDREELDWQRASSQAQKEKEFREWIQRPEIRAELFPEHAGGLSPETIKKIEKELRLL